MVGRPVVESEYERQRRVRIEANQAFLAQLGFGGADVLGAQKKPAAKPRKPRGRGAFRIIIVEMCVSRASKRSYLVS